MLPTERPANTLNRLETELSRLRWAHMSFCCQFGLVILHVTLKEIIIKKKTNNEICRVIRIEGIQSILFISFSIQLCEVKRNRAIDSTIIMI